jgi:hypothetical protein
MFQAGLLLIVYFPVYTAIGMCLALMLIGCWQDQDGSNCLGICLEGLSRTTATSHAILCTGCESAVHQTHTVQKEPQQCGIVTELHLQARGIGSLRVYKQHC